MVDNNEQESEKRDQVKQRREKLNKLREAGFNYPNNEVPENLASDIFQSKDYQDKSSEDLVKDKTPPFAAADGTT